MTRIHLGGGSAPDTSSHNFLGSIIGGAEGLVGNLAGDVRDAVVGLPYGTEKLLTDPFGTAKNIAKAEWTMYSPLFNGDFAKFGHNLYDHPLTPLLDVATVFSLGVAGAARAGELSKAADTSFLGKAAKLRVPKTMQLTSGDGRPDLVKNLSRAPSRRLVQETFLKLDDYLPNWFGETGTRATEKIQSARYSRAHTVDMAHRLAAKNLMISTALRAGKALSDPATAPRARQELAAGLYLNLHRHAHEMSADEWGTLAKSPEGAHYGLVIDSSLIDKRWFKELHVLRGKEKRWEAHRAAHAELAHALPGLRDQLDHQTALLQKMKDAGYPVAGGAKSKLKEPTTKQIMEYQGAPMKEVEQNIGRLTKQIERARSSKKIHDRSTAELGTLKSQRLAIEKRSHADYFRQAGKSDASFDQFVNKAGHIFTTRNLDHAAVTDKGTVRVVPMHDAHNLGHELKHSSKLAQYLWHKPTYLWKMALLGYSPRILVNNAVGNWIIHAVRAENPVVATRTVWDAIKFAQGNKVAATSLHHAAPFRRDHWMYRYFGNELGNVFSHDLASQGLKPGLRQGLYPLVHKYADEPVRVAAIYAGIRTSPEIQAAMRVHPSLSFDQAVSRTLRTDKHLRGRVAEQARTVAGDYFTLGSVGRQMRNVVPFYLWDRHILKSTGNLFADTPGRLALMQKVSNEGIDSAQQLLGSLPEFLRGALPLGVPHGGRANILLTSSSNPFATIGDLAGAGAALTAGGGAHPGNAILMQTNPLIAGGVQWLSGQNLSTGKPIPRKGGFLTGVPIQIAEQLPIPRLISEGKKGEQTISPSGNEMLFRHGPVEQLASLLGVPIRNVSLTQADKQARAEHPHKGRRKKRSTAIHFG